MLRNKCAFTDSRPLQRGVLIQQKDDFLQSLWARVRPKLQGTIETVGVGKLQRARSAELHELERVSSELVPELRRLTGPLLRQEKPMATETKEAADENAGSMRAHPASTTAE